MKPLCVICLFTIVSKIACNPTFVETTSGPIQGFISELNNKAVKAFLGIPFAQPPVGDLRFKKPKPVQPWTDTLQATEMPPACIQYTECPFPWYDDMPGKREDCLYLNIYTPIIATKGIKLPVMFWIHGGGFTVGSSRLDLYDPRALVQEGDVIVVTFNYRVDCLAFWTSNTEDAPGNVGVYDMVMALQWVNDNIEYFGGDKERITVFGESAGSIAISLFCVSP
ncbi:acetylcholinesterase-1 [Caerostris extrusa]|uniref:Carboxylic ester hydrolase n=1 Tax=Caerostris extrusa TaxID=172846 RepID=A0AAV4MML2_CAEEX|nr:acetylcholinesterase-1 [Caerostris extrusa]